MRSLLYLLAALALAGCSAPSATGPGASAPVAEAVAEVVEEGGAVLGGESAAPIVAPLAMEEPLGEIPRAPSALLVVIDPGHGGEKDGAIGPNRLKEKEAALAISLALRDRLEALGHAVVLTRESDLSLGLRERVEIANAHRADLFISVHLNSLPLGPRRARVSGVETYFLSSEASDADAAALARKENSDDEEAEGEGLDGTLDLILADLARTEAHASSSRLAYLLHTHLLRGVPARDRGVRQAPFAVLRGAEMPAVLVEVGYLSHPEEALRLADPLEQQRIAAALAEGVEAFFREVVERTSQHASGSAVAR